MSTEIAPSAIDWVERLHGVVDELVAPIVERNGARITCRSGCHDCCSDGLSVFVVEAAVIARHHPELLASGAPNEDGGCAFLDDRGECRIYAHRPYVCRTQGLPLRWREDDAEARDICPLNDADPHAGAPLEELAVEDCWTLGPIEERLATRQGDGERVALRSLFRGERRHLPTVR